MAISLDLLSDSGSNTTDNVTNTGLLQFQIKSTGQSQAEKYQLGDKVQVLSSSGALIREFIIDRTHLLGNSGNLSFGFSFQASADGDYSFSLKTFRGVTVKETAAPLKVTVDTNVSVGQLTIEQTTEGFAVSGTGEKGAQIVIKNGVEIVGTATVGADGKWSIAVDDALSAQKIVVSVEDIAGNKASSNEITMPTFVVPDTEAPDAPTIDLIAASDSANPDDNITSDKTPNLSGVAEAGSTVNVYNGAVLVATTTANDQGLWSAELAALADGVYTLTATATDAAGNVSDLSEGLEVTVDTVTAKPTISEDVVWSDNEDHSGSATLTGTAEAGSTVKVFADGELAGETTADASGNFTINIDDLADGVTKFTAQATDIAGNVSVLSNAVDQDIVVEGITVDGENGEDELTGTKGADTLNGGNGVDTVDGLRGRDNLVGGNGADTLNGGGGDDTIDGGRGDDLITGGSGDDVLTGGKGADMFVFGLGSGHDTITDFKLGTDTFEMSEGQSVVSVENGVVTFADDSTVTLVGLADVTAADLGFVI